MVTANATLKEMGNILAGADSVLLFPHVNPDPDAIGSSAALCRALRLQGIRAWVYPGAAVPRNLMYLVEGITEESGEESAPESAPDEEVPNPALDPKGALILKDPAQFPDPDICICVDCSEMKRIPGREETFRSGRTSLSIDHHQVKECEMDHYYIDTDAAAAALVIYQMLQEMDWTINASVAEALYTGLDGDTGCFMHSNTTPEVLRTAADLIEYGVDINKINVNLYQSKEPGALRAMVQALSSLDLFADGRAVLATLSAADLKACGADISQTDQVIDELRSIAGVELAAFLKEDGRQIRGSMRAKTTGNVAAIAEKFGGGGHIKASGFRSDLPLEEVAAQLKAEMQRALEDK